MWTHCLDKALICAKDVHLSMLPLVMTADYRYVINN